MAQFKAPRRAPEEAAKLRQRAPYVLHVDYPDGAPKGTPAYWEVHKRTEDGFEVVVNQLNMTPLRFDSREAAQACLETHTVMYVIDKVFD